MKVALLLNGSPVDLPCRNDEMLLDVLRREAGLTSVRETCRIGVCGVCTVLVDDEPMSACLVLAAQVAGRSVTTVEGLSENDPVVRAFVDHHAFQCGYCTPGFVLTARALLQENPAPDARQIAQALAGNLCRCGSYQKIFAAVQHAAADRPSTPRRTAMKLHNEFTILAPIERAWEILLDIERIAPCVPGATLTDREGDVYTGELKIKLGPILNTFAGSLTQQEVDVAGRRAVVAGRAQADRGQGRATATITSVLHAEGERTRVTVETDLNVTGPLAQFGRGVMEDVSGQLMSQFATCLAAELAAGPGATDTAEVLDLGVAGRAVVVKRVLPVAAAALIVAGIVVWSRRSG